jgi:RNA polymerase sigma factor for flagellar operon FliA
MVPNGFDQIRRSKKGKYMKVQAIAEAVRTGERERLIMEHLPQVRLISRRIHQRLPEGVALEDLVSTGIVGLISAIDHFDPRLNVKLKTYAEYKIRGAILDSLRGMDWAPRQRRKITKQIEAAILAAEQRLQRAPTEEEIAAELQVTLAEYHRRLVRIRGLNIGSLDNGDNSRNLLQFVADDAEHSPARTVERNELKRLLASVLVNIPPIERTVLSLYYDREMTLRKIARIVNLHESRISQLKAQALLRLRAEMQAQWPQGGAA